MLNSSPSLFNVEGAGNDESWYASVVPWYISISLLSIVASSLVTAVSRSSPKVRKDHHSILIQTITLCDLMYTLKFLISALAWVAGKRDPRSSFHLIADNCMSAAAYGVFFGLASIGWNSVWIIDFVCVLIKPLRNTSSLRRWYHVGVWSMCVIGTIYTLVTAGHHNSDNHTCLLRGTDSDSLVFEVPLFFSMILAFGSIILAFIRLADGTQSSIQVRRRLLIRHSTYVIAFILLWLWPVLQNILDEDNEHNALSVMEAIAVSGQAAVFACIRLSEQAAAVILWKILRQLRNDIVAVLCLTKCFPHIASSSSENDPFRMGNDFSISAEVDRSQVAYISPLLPQPRGSDNDFNRSSSEYAMEMSALNRTNRVDYNNISTIGPGRELRAVLPAPLSGTGLKEGLIPGGGGYNYHSVGNSPNITPPVSRNIFHTLGEKLGFDNSGSEEEVSLLDSSQYQAPSELIDTRAISVGEKRESLPVLSSEELVPNELLKSQQDLSKRQSYSRNIDSLPPLMPHDRMISTQNSAFSLSLAPPEPVGQPTLSIASSGTSQTATSSTSMGSMRSFASSSAYMGGGGASATVSSPLAEPSRMPTPSKRKTGPLWDLAAGLRSEMGCAMLSALVQLVRRDYYYASSLKAAENARAQGEVFAIDVLSPPVGAFEGISSPDAEGPKEGPVVLRGPSAPEGFRTLSQWLKDPSTFVSVLPLVPAHISVETGSLITSTSASSSVNAAPPLPPRATAGRAVSASLSSPPSGDEMFVASLADAQFSLLRARARISAEEIARALHPILLDDGTLNAHFSDGASSSFFCRSRNSDIIVKTIASTEVEVLMRLLPSYSAHLLENPASLLTRVYGCFCIAPPFTATSAAAPSVANSVEPYPLPLSGKSRQVAVNALSGGTRMCFIVMGSVFPLLHPGPTALTFDLKGSTLNRRARLSKTADREKGESNDSNNSSLVTNPEELNASTVSATSGVPPTPGLPTPMNETLANDASTGGPRFASSKLLFEDLEFREAIPLGLPVADPSETLHTYLRLSERPESRSFSEYGFSTDSGSDSETDESGDYSSSDTGKDAGVEPIQGVEGRKKLRKEWDRRTSKKLKAQNHRSQLSSNPSLRAPSSLTSPKPQVSAPRPSSQAQSVTIKSPLVLSIERSLGAEPPPLGLAESDFVLPHEDLKLGRARAQALLDQLSRDITLLASQGLMDYSLLVQLVPVQADDSPVSSVSGGIRDFNNNNTNINSNSNNNNNFGPTTSSLGSRVSADYLGSTRTQELVSPAEIARRKDELAGVRALAAELAVSAVDGSGWFTGLLCPPGQSTLSPGPAAFFPPASIQSSSSTTLQHSSSTLATNTSSNTINTSSSSSNNNSAQVPALDKLREGLSLSSAPSVSVVRAAALMAAVGRFARAQALSRTPREPEMRTGVSPFIPRYSPLSLQICGLGTDDEHAQVSTNAGSERQSSGNRSYNRRVIVQVGIIDMFQFYDSSKRMESVLKSIRYAQLDPDVSSVDPNRYAVRFMDFVSKVFAPE